MATSEFQAGKLQRVFMTPTEAIKRLENLIDIRQADRQVIRWIIAINRRINSGDIDDQHALDYTGKKLVFNLNELGELDRKRLDDLLNSGMDAEDALLKIFVSDEHVDLRFYTTREELIQGEIIDTLLLDEAVEAGEIDGDALGEITDRIYERLEEEGYVGSDVLPRKGYVYWSTDQGDMFTPQDKFAEIAREVIDQ